MEAGEEGGEGVAEEAVVHDYAEDGAGEDEFAHAE